MKIRCTVLLFFILATSLKGQVTEINVKFLPLNFIHPTMPHFTIGSEVIFKDRFGIDFSYGRRFMNQGLYHYLNYNLSIGPKNDNNLYFDSIAAPSFGERFHIDLKYYYKLSAVENPIGFKYYTGIRYINVHDIRNKEISYWVPLSPNSDTSGLRSSNAAIEKQLHIFNFTQGFVVEQNRFILDCYFSIGIKRKTQHFVHNKYHDLGYNSYRNFVWNEPMNKLRPSLNGGFKIGYKIFKK